MILFLFQHIELMSEPTVILRVLTKEESHIKKNQFVQHVDSNSIEYIENGKTLNKYQYFYVVLNKL